MGLTTDKQYNGGKNIYLKVMNGFLVQDVKEGTEGAVSRQNKNNETVHELLYTGLNMRITNIAMIDGKFGKELEVKGNSDGQNFVLQMSAGSGYAYGFLTRMPNLNFEIDTKIVPYSIPDKENPKKLSNVIVLYQGKDEKGKDKKVESAFTKENNFNGMPKLEKVLDPKDPSKALLVNGKEVWSDSARLEFFESIIYGEGGINETLIKLYGNPSEQENENKEDFGNEPEINEEELTESKSGASELNVSKAVSSNKEEGKKSTRKKK